MDVLNGSVFRAESSSSPPQQPTVFQRSSGAAAEELRNRGSDWQLARHQGRGERRLGSGVDEPGWRWVNAARRGQGLRRQQQH
ncbi:hypothetical protein INR49_002993 [Caranx melampygus]|nr:hypothetical protein INR49_002993 [Caranx melampygus]